MTYVPITSAYSDHLLRVTLEKAKIPADVADNVVLTVRENSRSAKFTNNSGFKTE
jgi:hypothetical protein